MKHKFLLPLVTILVCITSITFGQLINPYALTVSGGGGGGGGSGLTLVASDNFDSYSNGALLESQTGWTTFLGSMDIYKPASNGVVLANASGNHMVRRTDAYSTNQRSEAIASTFNPGSYRTLAVGVRCQSGGADTRYFFSTDGGTIAYLIARVAGVQTVINNGSFTPTLTAGDGIALEVTGVGSATRLTVQVYRSGAWSNLTGYVSLDPGVYIDGGYPGIGGDQSTFVDSGADSWAGYNLDGVGETIFVTAESGGANGDVAGTSQYGYAFTVSGGSQITVTKLGVERRTGTFADVTVKLFGADGITELASAVCDYDSVAVGDVAYTSITPVVIPASATRHIRLVNQTYNTFTNTGLYPETVLTTTGAATIISESEYDGSTLWTNLGTSAYVDFKYTTP